MLPGNDANGNASVVEPISNENPEALPASGFLSQGGCLRHLIDYLPCMQIDAKYRKLPAA
jgi:hypothetical protein